MPELHLFAKDRADSTEPSTWARFHKLDVFFPFLCFGRWRRETVYEKRANLRFYVLIEPDPLSFAAASNIRPNSPFMSVIMVSIAHTQLQVAITITSIILKVQ